MMRIAVVFGVLVSVLSYSEAPRAQSVEPAAAPKVTLKTLAAQVTALQGTVSSLQTTVTSQQSAITSLNGTISSLQGAQTSLQGTVTSLQGTTSSLQGSVSSLQGTEGSLQGSVSSLQGTTGSLQNVLSSEPAQNALALGHVMTADTTTGNVGIGTFSPHRSVSLGGSVPRNLGMDSNPIGGTAGNDFTINSGDAGFGSDLHGGDLLLATGAGTGLGGGGNARIQTAGAEDVSGTTGNSLTDREIMVGKAKPLNLAAPGFTSLMSIHLTGTHTAGGRIFYTIRATDGGSQIATEEGVIQYLATANTITCTVQTTDKLHWGTVNSGCTPGFFNPGSQPGISIFDNVSFISPAPLAVHEVYFKVENESGSSIRLEP